MSQVAALAQDAAALVASNLADFVRSDSDDLPHRVAQLAKLAATPEVSASISALSEDVTARILHSAGSSSSSSPAPGCGVVLSERLVDKLFSESGERLASTVAGSFACHLVLAYYSIPSPPRGASSPTMRVNVVTSTKCQKAISTWVEVIVGAAVREFIDRTIHVNTYEQLFEGLTNPKHDAKVKELLVSVCNGAVETLVKTTHHVFGIAQELHLSVRTIQ